MSAYAFLPCRDRVWMLSNREAKLQSRQVNAARGRIGRFHRAGIALDVGVVAFVKQIIERQTAMPVQAFTQGGDVAPGKRMMYTHSAGGTRTDADRRLSIV